CGALRLRASPAERVGRVLELGAELRDPDSDRVFANADERRRLLELELLREQLRMAGPYGPLMFPRRQCALDTHRGEQLPVRLGDILARSIEGDLEAIEPEGGVRASGPERGCELDHFV